MTMCLTTNTSQGITTSLYTRVQALLRVGHQWATPPTPRANTTQRPPTPVITRHLSTPTNKTITPPLLPLNRTLSPFLPLTPLPQLPQGPGSVSRSRRRSLSPTLKQGGRLSRPTHHPLLGSMCHVLHLRQVNRCGTLHTPVHRLRRCTLRWASKAVPQCLGEGSPRFQCPGEELKVTQEEQELRRVPSISPARYWPV